jgi:hypothetical protein
MDDFAGACRIHGKFVERVKCVAKPNLELKSKNGV